MGRGACTTYAGDGTHSSSSDSSTLTVSADAPSGVPVGQWHLDQLDIIDVHAGRL